MAQPGLGLPEQDLVPRRRAARAHRFPGPAGQVGPQWSPAGDLVKREGRSTLRDVCLVDGTTGKTIASDHPAERRMPTQSSHH
jgi:hypothetical protein